MPIELEPERGLTSTGQVQSPGARGDLGHRRAARHRNAVLGQEPRRAAACPAPRPRSPAPIPPTRVPTARKRSACRLSDRQLRIDRRNHQVDAVLGADAEQGLDELGVVAARHRQRQIRHLTGRRHRRLEIDRDHARLDAERRRAVAKALDQLDPAAGRGEQDGARRISPARAPSRGERPSALRAHSADGAVAGPPRPASSSKRGMVAWPSALMPSRFRTLTTVIRRILRSSPSDQWSTYQTSSARRRSQLVALRPCTAAQPVIPGRTSCRRRLLGGVVRR